MGIVTRAIVIPMLWFLATGSSDNHLRLEPPGSSKAFFTGDRLFVTCLAGQYSGATRMTWQAPSGRDITDSRGRVHVEAAYLNPLGLGLVFEDIRREDTGRYSCSAVIDGAERRTHFLLTVYLSISFWDTPDEQIGKEGRDYMVMCNVRAEPKPLVSWYANGSIVLENARYTQTDKGLYIRTLNPSDAGNYTCRAFVVTQHSSQMKDRNIVLHVHYRPVWHIPHMESAHGAVGMSVNLTCCAHSQPSPLFEWFRERALLGNSPFYRIANERWKSTLQVRITEDSAFGEYQCLATNIIGSNKRTISLLKGVCPSPPNFTVWSKEPGVLAVHFSSSDGGTLPVLGYRIQWRLALKSGWSQARYHPYDQGAVFVLQNLSLATEYAVRASAQNSIGFGNYSEATVIKTKDFVAETVMHDSSKSSSYNSAEDVVEHLGSPVLRQSLSMLLLYLLFIH